MAFSSRPVANNRWEVKDDTRQELLALALGRRNAERIVRALTLVYGDGEQGQLFDEAAA